MRVGVIACSKAKLERQAPVRELYQGQVFRLSLAWIERRVDHVVVLSARHHVLALEDVIEPYDQSLARMPWAQRKVWAAEAQRQLVQRFGTGAIYTVVAGADYRLALRGLPYVEDVITHWAELRKMHGVRRPAVGIGVLKRILKDERAYWRSFLEKRA